ncbi:MAG: AsmA family protein [Gammaproteobacteria bacterium]|jgi:AsmA protein
MGKFLKIILSIAAILVGLVVVAAIILPMVIDPNDYKTEIVAVVKDKTGRELEIKGDIGLSVFPWLGLELGTVRLGNAPGFEEPHMASMSEAQVRVKLLPLLKKQLEVDTVRLVGLQLNLAKDATGRTNWADLQAEAAPGPEQREETGKEGAPGLGSLAVGGIAITDASVVWDDRSTEARYAVDDLSLTTGEIVTGEAFDLDLRFTVAAQEPAVTSEFELTGNVYLAPGLEAIEVRNTLLNLQAQGDGVPGGKARISLKTDLDLDLSAQTLRLPNLVVQALGLNITGDIDGSGIGGDAPRFSGALQVAGFTPRVLIRQLGQPAPATTDPAVLGTADAALDWEASTQHVAVKTLTLHLDDTTVTGNARVDSFDAPAISFVLAVDTFNLDRYLPPTGAGGEPAAAPATGGKEGPPPLEGLRKLNLNGKITVAEMRAFNLEYRDAALQVKSRNGVLRMHPIGAKLYDGSYQGDITLDASSKTPRISVNETVSGVQAGPLLKDLIGDDKVLGTASLKAKFSGTGLTPEELRRTVNGNASFSFTDGAVKGVNIAALIRQARARLKGEAVSASAGPNQTDFAELSGTINVSSGVARNDDLLLQSPLLRIAGTGQTSLVEETIDYSLTTKLVGSLEGQGGRGLEDLKGVSIPVKVGGTWSKPSYTPDVASALSEVAREKVREKVDEKLEEQQQKIQEKIGDKLGDQLGDKLKGLFR